MFKFRMLEREVIDSIFRCHLAIGDHLFEMYHHDIDNNQETIEVDAIKVAFKDIRIGRYQLAIVCKFFVDDIPDYPIELMIFPERYFMPRNSDGFSDVNVIDVLGYELDNALAVFPHSDLSISAEHVLNWIREHENEIE